MPGGGRPTPDKRPKTRKLWRGRASPAEVLGGHKDQDWTVGSLGPEAPVLGFTRQALPVPIDAAPCAGRDIADYHQREREAKLTRKKHGP